MNKMKESSCHTICENNTIYSFLKLQNTNYIDKIILFKKFFIFPFLIFQMQIRYLFYNSFR